MDREEVFNILCKKIKSVKDVDAFSLSDRFKEDLGFDSVDMLLLILSLEKEFKISFNEPFIVLKVEDALEFILSHIKH